MLAKYSWAPGLLQSVANTTKWHSIKENQFSLASGYQLQIGSWLGLRCIYYFWDKNHWNDAVIKMSQWLIGYGKRAHDTTEAEIPLSTTSRGGEVAHWGKAGDADTRPWGWSLALPAHGRQRQAEPPGSLANQSSPASKPHVPVGDVVSKIQVSSFLQRSPSDLYTCTHM